MTKKLKTEFGKRRNDARPEGPPDPWAQDNLNQMEKEQEAASGLSPKNKFDPKLKLLPRPRVTGVSVGLRINASGPFNRLLDKLRKWGQKRENSKTLKREQKRLRNK